MTRGLARRLAWRNLRKNYRFFIPRILAETGLAACFYIIFTLACDRRLASVKGGEYLPTFMWMGAVIIGLLSLVLMLYTNSFLMKQRKREFGLYTVLGMEKKHVSRVLFFESLFSGLLSIVLGLAAGILLYKLSSLLICFLLRAEVVAGFYFVSPSLIGFSGAIFVLIDALTFLFNLLSLARMKPVELLASRNVGEKEPKVKWPLFVLGVLMLGGGYYLSLSTENPLRAIMTFFAAVLLVIGGTYFLFVAGSIFVLKALKKRPRYYYKPGHFTAVSGLLYRMKQNAVGLASVAILATGVLVMSSTTFCLYSRTEAVLTANYPQDYYLSASFREWEQGTVVALPEETVAHTVNKAAQAHGLEIREAFLQEFFEVTLLKRGNELEAHPVTSNADDFASLVNLTFLTEETYVRLGGEKLSLQKNEVAVCPYGLSNPGLGDFVFFDKEYRVKERLTTFPISNGLTTVNCYGVVVADGNVFDDVFRKQEEVYGDAASVLRRRYCVCFEERDRLLTEGETFDRDVCAALKNVIIAQSGTGAESFFTTDCFWEARTSLYGMYGTFLFLGVLLGTVCLFATVLIIYYKQISEGYEDRERFKIMRRIGLTEAEAKKTIRSQIMMVFFLPLLTAGVHVIFAYPLLTKLLEVLLLDDPWLFARWCLIVYAAFALVYALIYSLTARTYARIVQ